jgi:hypothetical protein
VLSNQTHHDDFPMCRPHTKLHWLMILLSALLPMLVTAFFLQPLRRDPHGCTWTIVGTNVARASVHVTLGWKHTVYYPSRFRWELQQACNRLGFSSKANSRVLSSSPAPAGDMIWLTCAYREKLHDPNLFTAEEVDSKGRRINYPALNGFLDEKRRASVSGWLLVGGIEQHRGSTFHIRTMSRGKELVRIEIP